MNAFFISICLKSFNKPKYSFCWTTPKKGRINYIGNIYLYYLFETTDLISREIIKYCFLYKIYSNLHCFLTIDILVRWICLYCFNFIYYLKIFRGISFIYLQLPNVKWFWTSWVWIEDIEISSFWYLRLFHLI